MHRYSALSTRLAFILAGLLAAAPAMADPPHGKGKGKGHDSARVVHFNDQHRGYVQEYYVEQHRSPQGCPPGLAKKNNGCMPPGQAKKWQVGQPLPRDITHYDVAPSLVNRLGPPPPGYRYVRVGGDILLVKTETQTVVDALQYLVR